MGAPNACLDDELAAVVDPLVPAERDVTHDDASDDDRPVISARALRARPTVVEGWLIERPIERPSPAGLTAPSSVRRPRPRVPAGLGAEWAVAVQPMAGPWASPGPAVRRTHVVPGWRPAAPPSRARRRVLAGAALLSAVVLGVLALSAVGGDAPSPSSSQRPEPVASVAYVARPGDTLWTIAREIQPRGDVRPLVDALAAQLHGTPLEPGDVVAWPPLPSGR